MKRFLICLLISISLSTTPIYADNIFQKADKVYQQIDARAEEKSLEIIAKLLSPFKEISVGVKEELKKDLNKEETKAFINSGVAGIHMNDEQRLEYTKALINQIDFKKKPNQFDEGTKFYWNLIKKIIENGKG